MAATGGGIGMFSRMNRQGSISTNADTASTTISQQPFQSSSDGNDASDFGNFSANFSFRPPSRDADDFGGFGDYNESSNAMNLLKAGMDSSASSSSNELSNKGISMFTARKRDASQPTPIPPSNTANPTPHQRTPGMDSHVEPEANSITHPPPATRAVEKDSEHDVRALVGGSFSTPMATPRAPAQHSFSLNFTSQNSSSQIPVKPSESGPSANLKRFSVDPFSMVAAKTGIGQPEVSQPLLVPIAISERRISFASTPSTANSFTEASVSTVTPANRHETQETAVEPRLEHNLRPRDTTEPPSLVSAAPVLEHVKHATSDADSAIILPNDAINPNWPTHLTSAVESANGEQVVGAKDDETLFPADESIEALYADFTLMCREIQEKQNHGQTELCDMEDHFENAYFNILKFESLFLQLRNDAVDMEADLDDTLEMYQNKLGMEVD